jgi:Fe-S cluster biogenesis protein NfuA
VALGVGAVIAAAGAAGTEATIETSADIAETTLRSIPIESAMSLSASSNPRSSASEILSRVERVLDEHVRPGLRTDGGDLEVVSIDHDNIVQVRLLGACQGCSSSAFTLTMLAEKAIKAHVPEVRFLEAVP